MWQAFIDFMLNVMMYLYQLLDNNFLLALVAFTVLTRVVMLPLNLRQQRSTIRMQEMQPQIQAIQKKYKDNQQKMMEEFNKIGYSPTEPLMGCLPLLVQMPIFFALFRVINIMLESSPQALLTLKSKIDPSFDLASLLPIDNTFLWMNLSQPDPYLVLPLLVAGSMFVSQRVMLPPKKEDDGSKKKKGAQQDDPTAQMQKSMQYTMPVMFGFFAMSFNSGLGIYFVVSNLIGMAQGLFVRRSMAQARAESEVRRQANIEAAARLDDDDDDAPVKSKQESKTKKKQNNVTSKQNKQKSKRKNKSR